MNYKIFKYITIIIIGYLFASLFSKNKECFNISGQDDNICSEHCSIGVNKDTCSILCNKVHDTSGNYMRTRVSNLDKSECNPSIINPSLNCAGDLDGINTSIPINPIWCPSNCIPTEGYDESQPPPGPPPGPPPDTNYSCSGSICISGTSGSGNYTTIDCDKKCGFSCNASNICIEGSSGSGSYNTMDECKDECESNIWEWAFWICLAFSVVFLVIAIALFSGDENNDD